MLLFVHILKSIELIIEKVDSLDQGSQTQTDLGAALD
jgi:hypothetical protein